MTGRKYALIFNYALNSYMCLLTSLYGMYRQGVHTVSDSSCELLNSLLTFQ